MLQSIRKLDTDPVLLRSYTELLHTHFQHSVLDSLPEWLRKMDDSYGDGLSMGRCGVVSCCAMLSHPRPDSSSAPVSCSFRISVSVEFFSLSAWAAPCFLAPRLYTTAPDYLHWGLVHVSPPIDGSASFTPSSRPHIPSARLHSRSDTGPKSAITLGITLFKCRTLADPS